MQTLFHNDKEMRTIILFDENNNQGILDISIVDYNKLNTVKRLLGVLMPNTPYMTQKHFEVLADELAQDKFFMIV